MSSTLLTLWLFFLQNPNPDPPAYSFIDGPGFGYADLGYISDYINRRYEWQRQYIEEMLAHKSNQPGIRYRTEEGVLAVDHTRPELQDLASAVNVYCATLSPQYSERWLLDRGFPTKELHLIKIAEQQQLRARLTQARQAVIARYSMVTDPDFACTDDQIREYLREIILTDWQTRQTWLDWFLARLSNRARRGLLRTVAEFRGHDPM